MQSCSTDKIRTASSAAIALSDQIQLLNYAWYICETLSSQGNNPHLNAKILFSSHYSKQSDWAWVNTAEKWASDPVYSSTRSLHDRTRSCLHCLFFFNQSVMVWWTEPRCKSTKSTSVPSKNNPSGWKKSNNKKHSRRSKKQKRRDGIKTSPCCQCAGLRVVPKRTKKKVCFQKVRQCWALEEKHSREGRSTKLVTLLKVSLITFSGEATIRRWGAGIEAA